MKFEIDLNGQPCDVELPRLVPGNATPAVIDGERHEVELVSTTADQIILEIDGQRFELRFRRLDSIGSPAAILLSHRNRPYHVAVTSELDRFQTAAASARKPSGPSTLLSQLPGVVRQIFVEVGSVVEAGKSLLTLEAMKMENEIRADITGRIEEILVEPGQVVAAREALVRIVPE